MVITASKVMYASEIPSIEDTTINENHTNITTPNESSYIATLSYNVGDSLDYREVADQVITESLSEIYCESLLEEGILQKEHIGVHPFKITGINEKGTIDTYHIEISVSDIPNITLESPIVEQGDIFDLNILKVNATDAEDGDITEFVTITSSLYQLGDSIPISDVSEFELELTVSDSDMNIVSKKFIIEIVPKEVNSDTDYSNEDNLLYTDHQFILNQSILNENESITIGGDDRYLTAIGISKKMFQKSDVVILTSSSDFPDALTAGPIATKYNAPILLTRGDMLTKTTENELIRLQAKSVLLIGGEGVISPAVENTLKRLGLKTERVSGIDRYETSIASAVKMGFTDKVILASGLDFADAITSGSYAAKNGYPILLTRPSTIPENVLNHIMKHTKEVLIVGGNSSVSKSVEDTLVSKGVQVSRVAGIDRYETSTKMADKFFTNVSNAIIANGLDFADALTAVPYAAYLNAPILLTRSDRVSPYLGTKAINSNLNTFHHIGGNAVISNNVKGLLKYYSDIELRYRTLQFSGTWTGYSSNGDTSGKFDSPLSKFNFELDGIENLNVISASSLEDIGWQSSSIDGSSGTVGKKINGLLMKLSGTRNNFSILYRAYLKNKGWTSWTENNMPIGGPSGTVITAIQAKIVLSDSIREDKNIFPEYPPRTSYAYTTAYLNVRSGEGSSYPILTKLQNRTAVRILSINSLTNWAKIEYRTTGSTSEGFVSMAYIKQEELISRTILTVDNLTNGQGVPNSDIIVQGIAAHASGVSEVKYYINGKSIGTVIRGLYSSQSLNYGYSVPQSIGYQISIPASSWIQGRINTLRIELISPDGLTESETIYLNGSKDNIVFEKYNASLNYFANLEFSKKSAVTSNGSASFNDIARYMDPSLFVSHDIYKYMFLDLSFNSDNYNIQASDLNKVLENKGVLHNMGEVFLKAAKDFNINPFYLISHSILETGHGTSILATGQKLNYYHRTFGVIDSELIELSPEDKIKTWYNVYGIGAYDGNANLWGAEKAYHEKWDSIEKAIYYGTEWIAGSYITRVPEPQNTNYKMRYNLNESMSHQYATDVMWAYKQAARIKNQFDSMGVNVPLRFIIPEFSHIRP